MTTTNTLIEHAAHAIAEVAYNATALDTPDALAAEYNAQGWTFDIRLGSETPGNWTHIENYYFTDEELVEVVARAEAIIRADAPPS